MASTPHNKDSLTLSYIDGPQGSPTPDTDEKAAAQSPERRWSSTSGRHHLVGFLPTAIVVITTLGFVVIIVGFLLGTQYVPEQGGRGFHAAIHHKSFVLNEDKWSRGKSGSEGGHLRVLVISALASHLISDTSSILMTLIAYRIGAQWLRVSREGESGIAKSPTAFQYGLIVRLLGSSSISAIGETCVYAARSRTRHQLPRLFKQALGMSAGVWIFARLVGLADLWLHTTSKSIPVLNPIPDAAHTYMFAAKFNETICPAWRAVIQADVGDPSIDDIYPCSSTFEDFVFFNDPMSDTGFKSMGNESYSAWNAITLANEADLAVLVPGPAINTSSTSYTVSTFAIRANCNSLNSLCTKDATNATTNCTAAGYPQLPHFTTNSSDTVVPNSNQVDDFIFGVVDGQLAGTEFGTLDIDSPMIMVDNPATMAVQLRWNSRVEGVTRNVYGLAANSTDLAIDTYPQPTLYAGCEVSFFNASVRLDGKRGTWSLLELTPSSPEFSTTLWLPTVVQHATEHLASTLFVIAKSRPKGEVMAALNQHLARLMLGAASGYFEPAPATEVYRLVPLLLGQYPVAPVLTFISLLCLYALLALSVFLSSWWTTDETIVFSSGESTGTQPKSILALTQAWLTSPAPLVEAALLGAGDQHGVQPVTEPPSGMFYDGKEGDARLGIGMSNNGFGLWRRATGKKETGVEEA